MGHPLHRKHSFSTKNTDQGLHHICYSLLCILHTSPRSSFSCRTAHGDERVVFVLYCHSHKRSQVSAITTTRENVRNYPLSSGCKTSTWRTIGGVQAVLLVPYTTVASHPTFLRFFCGSHHGGVRFKRFCNSAVVAFELHRVLELPVSDLIRSSCNSCLTVGSWHIIPNCLP